MTHQEALQQHAVERYMLGELSGAPRDRFEEHLFDCPLCAADLEAGVVFLEGARKEWQFPAPAPARLGIRGRLAALGRPWVLAPALAACLGVIVFQSAILLPALRSQLAQARGTQAATAAPDPRAAAVQTAVQTAAVVEPLVLANAGARGDQALPRAVAPRGGFYLLAVDIPPVPAAAAYRCTLVSPSGRSLWTVDVTPAQAREAVTLRVLSSTAEAGTNELRIDALPATGNPQNSAKLDSSVRYKYNLTVEP